MTRTRRRIAFAAWLTLGVALAPPAAAGAAAPFASLTSATAGRGQVAIIQAVLFTDGQPIAATNIDLFFPLDALTLSAADCSIDPRLTASNINKQLTATVTADTPPGAPAGTRRARVAVFSGNNSNAIPDGVLFSCAFSVLPQAASGTKTLFINPSASAPNGAGVALGGAGGTITVLDPSIDINSGAGERGGSVPLTGTLQTRGASIATTSNDIYFAANAFDVAPDACAAHPRLAGLGKTLAVAVTAGTPNGAPPGSRRLRAEIIGAGSTAISDGPLFTCGFTILPDAPIGTHALRNDAAAADPQMALVTITAGDGSITVIEVPTHTPTPTRTVTETPTSTRTETRTVTSTATESVTRTPSPTLTTTGTRTATRTVTLSRTPTETATQTPPFTPSITATPSRTASATETPVDTRTATVTATTTATRTASATASVTVTRTPTATLEATDTRAPSRTATPSPASTNTRTATVTRTATATAADTGIPSVTPTRTQTATFTLTFTRTPTPTRTGTATRVFTRTPTPRDTATPQDTATETETPTTTPTETASPEPSATATPSETPTPPVPCGGGCCGDCDGDEERSGQDVARIVAMFNSCPACGEGGVVTACGEVAGGCIAADANGDGCISAGELTRVVAAVTIGGTCP